MNIAAETIATLESIANPNTGSDLNSNVYDTSRINQLAHLGYIRVISGNVNSGGALIEATNKGREFLAS